MKLTPALFLLAAIMGGAQQADAPPVVTVHITAEERAEIDAADKHVADMEAALQNAKQNQSVIESDIASKYREKLKLPWADCRPSLLVLNFSTMTDSSAQTIKQDDAKG